MAPNENLLGIGICGATRPAEHATDFLPRRAVEVANNGHREAAHRQRKFSVRLRTVTDPFGRGSAVLVRGSGYIDPIPCRRRLGLPLRLVRIP